MASTSAYTPASSPSSTSGEYFLNTTCPSAAVKISSASPWRMRWVRLISLGMTTRPSSSILRTIPVAFIGVSSCPSIFCTIYLLYGKCGGLCMVRACFCQCFIQPCQQGITLNGLAMWAFMPASNTFCGSPQSHLHFGNIITERRVNFRILVFCPQIAARTLSAALPPVLSGWYTDTNIFCVPCTQGTRLRYG